jgi:hypothetical protein
MQKALAINADLPKGSAILAFNMGMVFSLGYTKDKAVQCLETCLEIDPNYEPAQKALERLKESDTNHV